MGKRMTLKGPAAGYQHKHSIRDINSEFSQHLTVGQRVADAVARVVGSWSFIIIQTVIIAIWMAFNVYLAVVATVAPDKLQAWDPYPFILLNLVLSFQAAYTGPVVMMSQNRLAERDRLMAEQDYETNIKAEEEIQILMRHLIHHDEILTEILNRLDTLQPAVNQEDLIGPGSQAEQQKAEKLVEEVST